MDITHNFVSFRTKKSGYSRSWKKIKFTPTVCGLCNFGIWLKTLGKKIPTDQLVK